VFTRAELENALGGLLEAFPNAFNTARMERITAIVQGIALSDLKRISEHILDHARYAPLPEDFKKAIRDLGITKSSAQTRDASYRKKKIDIAYIEGDWFFNDDYVFNRALRVTVLRAQNPDHAMVKKAAEKEVECLAGRAKFIPAVGSGFPDPTKETLDFFYFKNDKKTVFDDILEKIRVPSL
jgi:hypothetical protein